MNSMMPTLEPYVELDHWICEFERAWQEMGGAALADFLPDKQHPQFARILCELVCIDLEMHWSRGKHKRLSDYRADWPQLFLNESVIRELAYEEYRQRIQAGDRVDRNEYRNRYAIDVSSWPERPQAHRPTSTNRRNSSAATN